jgi:metal-responsive CopG/Arc/MetJ family transcriptional regulator
MRNTLKIAISLPKEDFYKLEQIRKKLGFGRSTIIDKAIRFWLSYREQEDLIKRYREGYRKKPESIKEIEAFEKAAAEAFKSEDLQ